MTAKFKSFVVLALTLTIASSLDAGAQNVFNKVKDQVQQGVQKVAKKVGSGNVEDLSQGDKKILSSCGLNDISLDPIGAVQKDGVDEAVIGSIPKTVTEQLDWRDKLPAPWKCSNRTLVEICDKIDSYDKKRQKDPQTYQWNEVLAVADANYDDDELSKRLDALEAAAEAYNECKAVFGDSASTDQDKRVAAQALANAVKNACYKRALNSSLTSLYPKIKNLKVVNTLRNASLTDVEAPKSPASTDDEK